MNSTIFNGNWNQLKGSIKQYIGELIGSNLLYVEGVNDKKLGKMQIKIGKLKEELLKVFPLFKNNRSLIQLQTSIKF